MLLTDKQGHAVFAVHEVGTVSHKFVDRTVHTVSYETEKQTSSLSPPVEIAKRVDALLV
jgi:hypothetical protein